MAAAANRGWARRACGWAHRACPWIFPFFVFYLINLGGQQNASKNRSFTVTFDPRRLQKPPRLIDFARLRKDFL